MINDSVSPLSRRANVITQEIDNQILIYDLNINKVFNLNETSTLIWLSCDGKKTVSEIAEEMSVKLRSLITEEFVWLALDQLKKEGLLENGSEISIPFKSVTRRDVIRRVGLSTLAALPLILAIATPTAAAAGSTCTPNDVGLPCPGGPSDCCVENNTRCCDTINIYSNGMIVTQTTQCEAAINNFPNGASCTKGCDCAGPLCKFGTCCSGDGSVTAGMSCTTNCDCLGGYQCIGTPLTCQVVP